MAGIGFVLRKLAQEDNLLGMLRAYGHAALASCGPWLFTVLALGALMMLEGGWTTRAELYEFRLIIIYNFSFSLVLSAPVYMVATRYLADGIHHRNVSHAPGMMLAALMVTYIPLPVVCWFYMDYAALESSVEVATVMNFALITGIWVISVFLTALKDFRAVTWAFASGIAVTVMASAWLVKYYGTAGLLTGFNAGMACILFALMARIFAEYPYRMQFPPHFFFYFRRYWKIALAGLVYNMAAWVDKWIMWFAPEAERLPSRLLLFSDYDSAMFLAYLTIVPAMAAFVFSVETRFFERYLRFYQDIQQQATFARIQRNHRRLIASVFSGARNFMILQGSIAVVTVLTAPSLFEWLHIDYLQLGIFRFGVLGAMLHVFVLFLSILLSYFDNQRAVLGIALVFLFANALATVAILPFGFAWYGYGYFLAALLAFIVASVVCARYMYKLPYHTFITRNQSVTALHGNTSF